MRKFSVIALAFLAVLTLSLNVAAQDQPVVPETGSPADIADVVANTDAYYGTTVTLEGNIVELVNVKLFVLDDGALLATNQVVVVNNTGFEYPIWVSADERVRVTGIVHPRTNDGGMDALVMGEGRMTDPALEPTHDPAMPLETVTPDPAQPVDVTPAPDMTQPEQPRMMDDMLFVNPLTYDVIPERLHDWVIIELVSIENVLRVVE